MGHARQLGEWRNVGGVSLLPLHDGGDPDSGNAFKLLVWHSVDEASRYHTCKTSMACE